MIDKRGEKHRYGQHYTPVDAARLLAAFAVQSSDDLVFDPSCGDGRLLREALDQKKSLAAECGLKDRGLARQVFGIDRFAPAVRLAAATGARVARADFFDIEPGAKINRSIQLPARFDAIIGNPPYIRQEVIGDRDKRRLEKRLENDRRLSPEMYWPRWSGRSDVYVYFFARSIRFLKPEGRLVFLTASSWLDAAYGAALREFLARNFRILAIIESAAESFFADASINTAITVLARKTDSTACNNNPVRFVQLSRTLSEIFDLSSSAAEFARSIERTASSITLDTHRIRVVNQTSLLAEKGIAEASRPAQGWSRYLRAADVFFQALERGSGKLAYLSDLARVRFGVKTGANDFFYVVEGNGSAAGMKQLGEVASIRRGLTTGANDFFYLKALDEKGVTPRLRVVEDGPGARHLIESEYLSPVIFSLKEIPGIPIEEGQGGKLFFNCSKSPDELKGTNALEYIRSGERAGYHLRPTCAARDPWYGVARGMKPAPIIFPAKVGERWLVAINRAGVFEDKKLYGIFPRKPVSKTSLAALLNSTWARYYAEITCRQMTGAQAIADIDVAVAERIMLPDPRRLSQAVKRKLETSLDALTGRPVLSVFEEVKRADRRRLDLLTLEAIGFTDKAEREKVLYELYEAVIELVRRRLARSQ